MTPFRVATYNVNGIGARLPRLIEWLEETRPDVACLQEIKCQDASFPTPALKAIGYQVETVGQKGFNGVAILSRHDIEVHLRALPGDEADEQARYLEAGVAGLVVGCLYLPNGNPQPGPKFDYKLGWLSRLEAHARLLLSTEQPFLLAGDYNVCPQDSDVFDTRVMANDALVQPETRAAYRRIEGLGLTDAIRAVKPDGHCYTFWDYQAGAWEKDNGLRIDHLLLSPQASDLMIDAGIDRVYRGRERPSDHTPVWVSLER